MSRFLQKKNIRLLISDMAGTTINENGIIYQSIYNTLSKMNINLNINEKEKWYGRDKREVLSEYLENISLEEAEKLLLDELNNEYFIKNNASLIDKDLPLFLNKIRENNILVTLNTGYPTLFQNKIINHFDLRGCIDNWISSQQVEKGRPHPYMIQEMMRRYHIKNPKFVAKVGDTVNDMKEGKNANCGLVIGVLTGDTYYRDLLDAGADIVIDKITNL